MEKVQTKRIRVTGVVQGVGFRPFVSRLARRLGLNGSVANMGSYVEIFLQGDPEKIAEFAIALEREAPPRADILQIVSNDVAAPPQADFRIAESGFDRSDILVSPDIAICGECLAELYDPADRRYRHPFINCTACGPRLTIQEAVPYDRERTSMKDFPMCETCAREYHAPASRRYDAQPVCCHDCGPEVYLLDRPERGPAAIRVAREAIIAGKIVAVKGIGGFHLACDAGNADAVRTLRERKRRPAKPFAVMMQSLDAVRKYCLVPPEAESLLTGHRKPIVLLPRRADCALPDELAPGNPTLGVMLPYAPVQHLLFRYDDELDAKMPDALVMTSGNVSGAPIARDDDGARREIAGFCDLILSHGRPILLRADDSVTDLFRGEPYMIRRSRGYAPLPFVRSSGRRGSVLALGGELKNTFCLAKNDLYYLSPYIGDMADLRTADALEESAERMQTLFEVRPKRVACDLHPGYFTTQYAESSGLEVVKFQHHWAHILSCMAENDWTGGPVIGVAFDGTGYGTDGTIWGGEFLTCTYTGFERRASIAPFMQAGGDASAREGWRIAGAHLLQSFGEEAFELARKLELSSEQEMRVLAVMTEKKINCVASTSAGRLFDAAAAILGLASRSTFEGEAAMKLEFAAMKYAGETPDLCPGTKLVSDNGLIRLDTAEMMKNLVRERLAGGSPEMLACAFHRTLAEMTAEACGRIRAETGLDVCALSGGVFQNVLFLEEVLSRLERAGFRVLRHRLVPPNDGGIALGQAAACMEMNTATT